MLKDMFGKLGDAVPEDLKEQAKDKIKEKAREQLEGVEKRFFGDSAPSSSPEKTNETSGAEAAPAPESQADSESTNTDSNQGEEVA